MKLEFSRHSLVKYSNIKFHKNPSSESRAVPITDGRTDMKKLIVDFRNSANAPKNKDYAEVQHTRLVGNHQTEIYWVNLETP
jgi:hypothetical protein